MTPPRAHTDFATSKNDFSMVALVASKLATGVSHTHTNKQAGKRGRDTDTIHTHTHKRTRATRSQPTNKQKKKKKKTESWRWLQNRSHTKDGRQLQEDEEKRKDKKVKFKSSNKASGLGEMKHWQFCWQVQLGTHPANQERIKKKQREKRKKKKKREREREREKGLCPALAQSQMYTRSHTRTTQYTQNTNEGFSMLVLCFVLKSLSWLLARVC